MVYGISIMNKLFEGVLVDEGSFCKIVTTDVGNVVMPSYHKLYNSAEERNASIFNRDGKHLSIDEVSIQYNITKEDATVAYQRALIKFPEKFI